MTAPSTIKLYQSVINGLIKRDIDDFNYSDELMHFLETNKNGSKASLNTVKSKISAIMYENKSRGVDPVQWHQKFVELVVKISKEKTYGATEDTITWAELKDLYKSTKIVDVAGGLVAKSQKLLLAVYSLLPPRRILDFSQMKVVEKMPKLANGFNYVAIGTKRCTMQFNVYKTEKNYGRQNFPVPAALKKLIVASGATVGQPLFPTMGGGYYSQAEFSTRIGNATEKLIGKRATVNSYRHAYITNFLSSNPTTPQRKKVAAAMGQSVSIALEYDQRPEED
jgi:hypothetical protein